MRDPGATLFIDPQRCIGCRACVQACSECPGHRGISMIHLDEVARSFTVQTAPTVCMHCDPPACATVCPADAIHKGPDGVVHSALPERCIGCANCALACPFGVPKVDPVRELMVKCDLCHERTSVGKAPMCATVCPSGALMYGTRSEVEDQRRARQVGIFRFGDESVRTRVQYLVPSWNETLPVNISERPTRTTAELCMEEAIV
mgnify:FL=1